MNTKETFMGYVQMHERVWGMESYPGRPALDDILAASVVAFWYPTAKYEVRYTVTLHEDLDDLNNYFSKVLLRTKISPPKRRLARLFVNQKQMKILGVQLIVAEGK